MYFEGSVRIGRANNGYIVQMRDPKLVAQNRKRDLAMRNSNTCPPYVDPDVQYVFDDIASLTTFLAANLDKALPKDDYASSFDAAAADAAGDD